MTGQPLPELIDYGAMRLRWCRLALKAFLLRWGVYVVVTAAVASAGTTDWMQVIQALSAALVLPLFQASQFGWLLLPATLLQGLFGTTAVWAARNLLWPLPWAESERALPVPRRLSLRSDLHVVLWVLTPLLVLYGAGAAAVLGHHPAWLQATWMRALLALVVAAASSVALGVLFLQRQRRYRAAAGGRLRWVLASSAGAAGVAGEGKARSSSTKSSASAGFGGRSQAPWAIAVRSLFWLALWRGPARRTGATLLAGAFALGLPALLLFWSRSPAGWPWALAGFATLALLVCTRVNHLARLELAGLLQACAVLPIRIARLKQFQASLGLWPVLPGLALLLGLAWRLPPAGLRVGVLLAWSAACLVACLVELTSQPAEASAKASRWLFSLIVCLCLASEAIA